MSDPSTESHATPPEIIGQMAGEYRLRRKLGEGGYGAVYEAEHPVLKRRAAVKVLHRTARMDANGAMRFISEAQAANQIRSRYIVDIFSFGKLADGRHFYVMDMLDGEPLDRLLARAAPLDVPTALQLLVPIAEALDAAHAAGIVHRDLKPQNIFLVWEPSGETVPKLLDFGMAKLMDQPAGVQTASGALIGTPLYMSPEQALGKKVDGRADVYALGLLCHELLTGKTPFKGETAVEVLAGHLTAPPPRVSESGVGLSPELDGPILRMLEKLPESRPPTAGVAISELRRAAEAARRDRPDGHAAPSSSARVLQRTGRDPPGYPFRLTNRARTRASSERGFERGARSSEVNPRKLQTMFSVVGALALLAGAAVYLSLRGAGEPARTAAGSLALPPSAPVAAAPAAASIVNSESPAASVDFVTQGAPRGARVSQDG